MLWAHAPSARAGRARRAGAAVAVDGPTRRLGWWRVGALRRGWPSACSLRSEALAVRGAWPSRLPSGCVGAPPAAGAATAPPAALAPRSARSAAGRAALERRPSPGRHGSAWRRDAADGSAGRRSGARAASAARGCVDDVRPTARRWSLALGARRCCVVRRRAGALRRRGEPRGPRPLRRCGSRPLVVAGVVVVADDLGARPARRPARVALVALVAAARRPTPAARARRRASAAPSPLAVLATQYDDGGGLQWGGRYLAPPCVPLGVARRGGGRAPLPASLDRRGVAVGAARAAAAVVGARGHGRGRARSTRSAWSTRSTRPGEPTWCSSRGDQLRPPRLARRWPERCWVARRPRRPRTGAVDAVRTAAGVARAPPYRRGSDRTLGPRSRPRRGRSRAPVGPSWATRRPATSAPDANMRSQVATDR